MSIDISQVPKPDVVEKADFETILAERKADLLSRYPQCQDVIDDESEPLVYLLQSSAYRELVYINKINDSSLAMLLAYAENGDLDAVGLDRFQKPRLVLVAEDLSTIPPTPAVMESDNAYRARLWRSMDALSTAGPAGAYESIAFDVSADIADAKAHSPSDGVVVVSFITHSNNGVPTAELISQVNTAVSDPDKRVMTDNTSAQAASITGVNINATLTLTASLDNTGVAEVMAAALASVEALKTKRKIGESLALSKIYSALHVSGVNAVNLTNPTADINPGPTGAVIINGIDLTAGD